MTISAGHMHGREARTIAISGSRGLIGSALVRALEARGDAVRRLSRRPSTDELRGADAVVNLAGENIAQRWTSATRVRIRESRVQATASIANAIASSPGTPRVLLSGSAIGIYGAHRGDEELDESSALGEDFLASVCREWEAATMPAERAGARVVHLRTGIVLSREGGALAKMLMPFRFGAGGPLGDGRQWMSWISLADHVRAMLFLLDRADASGPVNLVAPEPVRNLEFAHTLGRVMHRPSLLSVPRFAMKLALGEMAEDTALASQRVVPRRLGELGFAFEYSRLDVALTKTLGRDAVALL